MQTPGSIKHLKKKQPDKIEMEIDLCQLNTNSESETLELKESFSNEALESIGAFATAQGGTLLIGVRNNGKVIGITIRDRTEL